MQTLSGMQRSFAYQTALKQLGFFALFVLYLSLSSIYPLLPPLFAILFVLYMYALKKKEGFLFLLIIFALLLYEAEKGYMLFSALIFFVLLERFVVPKLKQNFNCKSCITFIIVVMCYIGFYLYLMLIANIFILPKPDISLYYAIYYIMIEFLLVSLL